MRSNIVDLSNDILAGCGQENTPLLNRLRRWGARVTRFDLTPFCGWDYILPLIQPSVLSRTRQFRLIWGGPPGRLPQEIAINGYRQELTWCHFENEFVCEIAPGSFWNYENILSAKSPLDWKHLSLWALPHEEDEKTLPVQELNAEMPWANIRAILTHRGMQHIGDATEFILQSKNLDQKSRFWGLCYGCYDLDGRGYRLVSWVWTNGIVINALLNTQIEALTDVAVSLGQAALKFRVDSGDNEGAFLVRYDPIDDVPQGYTEWLAPNDAALLGGYGFLPLYDETKDVRYWDTAVGIAEWILREGIKNKKLRVGYRQEQKKWDDSWLYVDAGFTPVLFARLHERKPEEKWRQACIQIMDDLIARLHAGNGNLYSAWLWPGRKGKNQFSRGYAWFLDGLLHTYRCSREQRFLDVADACANRLLRYQHENGGWFYLLDQPQSGFCNKGIPAIAWQLLNLFDVTGEEKFKVAARKGLDWCLDNQYAGEDKLAYGGIVSWNTEGAISGIKSVRTAFPYASGLQILSELLWKKIA